MNYLVAKLKGNSENIFRVMSQHGPYFQIPAFDNVQAFSPNYKLEEDEWFKLEAFATLGYGNPLVGVPFNSAGMVQLLPAQYAKVSYFCVKQGDFLLFQKFGPSQIISKNWFSISDAPALNTDTPIIVLNSYLDAVYDINDDALYFKDFVKLKGLFRNIEELYREATEVEVTSFLANTFLDVDPAYTVNHVKSANRKRIAIAMVTLNNFSVQQKADLFVYVQEYCGTLPVNGQAFVVSSEDHLKQVLYGIEQRYFTTQIGGEKRLANSIQVLG